MYIVLYIYKNIQFLMKPDFLTNWSTQLKKGLLLYLILSIIRKKSSYGQEIIKEIEAATGFLIAEGTLYPLLKKLKEEQLVLSKWDTNEDKAPRKYYYLTGKGGVTLKEMNKKWENLTASVSKLIVKPVND